VSVSARIAAMVLALVVIGIGVGYFFLPYIPTNSTSVLNQNPEEGVYRFTGNLPGDDAYLIHSFYVNISAESMYVTLDCGFNDFDLYLAHGYTPTEFDYDWRGFNVGGEDMTINFPANGIWHVMVHSYSGAGDYSLSIDIAYD
jgi:hypothetical protein